jgi:excisionase family DNA binding protein
MSQLLTPQQVAELLQVSIETVYRLLNQPDGLVGIRVGTGRTHWRIREEDLQAYIQARTQQ